MRVLPNGELLMFFRDDENLKHFPRSVITAEGVHAFGYRNIRQAYSPIPRHVHRDCYEIFYVSKGNLNLACGSKLYSLKGGDAIIVKPGELHSTGDMPLEIHEGYYLRLCKSGPLLGVKEEWADTIHDRLEQSENRVLHPQGDLTPMLSKAMQGVISQNVYRKNLAQAALLAFLYEVFESEFPEYKRAISEEIAKSVQYIGEHIRKNPTIEGAAESCGLSVSSFKHRFRREVGTSPMEYINRCRIDEAKKLLAQGWSVTDTAYELDFTSSNYFSAVFRRVTSMTATQYRAKAMNQE